MVLLEARDIAKENKDDTVYMFTNDKDFKFNSQNAADAVNFEKEVTDKKE